MPKLTPSMLKRLRERDARGEMRFLPKELHGVDFASSDYLGYTRSKLLKDRILRASADVTSVGSSGSRLLTGNSHLAEEVEGEVARFFRFPCALVFSSGFALNSGFLASIADDKDVYLLDENAHASLKIGMKLSKAAGYFFRHNDSNHLESRLKRLSTLGSNIFVVVESLYSMDGDITPLLEIANLCEQWGARLIVDEAHAAGTIGQGHGLVAEQNLQERVFASIVTFGKAFACHGAAILGSAELMTFVVNFCQSFVYTTAPSSFFFLAIREALRLFAEQRGEFQKLQSNIKILGKMEVLGIQGWHSPIVAVPFPAESLRGIAHTLQEGGFATLPIFSPTVKRGSERLRVCIHAFNREDEILRFAELIKDLRNHASKNLRNGNSHWGREDVHVGQPRHITPS